RVVGTISPSRDAALAYEVGSAPLLITKSVVASAGCPPPPPPAPPVASLAPLPPVPSSRAPSSVSVCTMQPDEIAATVTANVPSQAAHRLVMRFDMFCLPMGSGSCDLDAPSRREALSARDAKRLRDFRARIL